MEDLYYAGGVYAVMAELAKKDLIDTSLLTCTGKTHRPKISRAWSTATRRSSGPSTTPTPKTGGIAVLKGNLAPGRLRGEAVRRGPGR